MNLLMHWKLSILLLAFLTLAIAGILFFTNDENMSQPNNLVSSTTTSVVIDAVPTRYAASQQIESKNALAEPIRDFRGRVTKKPFGIFIAKQNSPIEPERFSGYHTGIDVEYEDIANDVPVYAIAECEIVLSRIVSGYGGVVMISFELNGTTHTALYGHIRPSSLPVVGEGYKKGDQLAVLGTGYSDETDGERRHLHFAILAGNSLNIKGYTQSESELSGWIDPLTIL